MFYNEKRRRGKQNRKISVRVQDRLHRGGRGGLAVSPEGTFSELGNILRGNVLEPKLFPRLFPRPCAKDKEKQWN